MGFGDPLLHTAKVSQHGINHPGRDNPGEFSQVTGRETPRATTIRRMMTDWNNGETP
jgi:hypothetical protein